LREVDKDPAQAFDTANSWAERGGGYPASHCAALALLKMGQYDQAAMRLEQLATDMAHGEGDLSVEALAQAGQAWLLARKPERAFAAQSAALKLRPRDVDLLIDRAVTLGEAKNYWEAIDDLNRALELDPRRVDAHVLRASAYRYVESPEMATEDLAAALALDPRNPDALAERGIIKRLANDPAGARQDWLTVLRTAPDSPAGDIARDNLEKLDVKVQ
jgi:tetratricopeptide (TPR) repeat protein